MKISEILNKPFPFIDGYKSQLRISFLFACFVCLFLLVFQPFGISDIEFYKPLFVFGYGGITFFVMFISFVSYSNLLSQLHADNWNVRKMLMFSFIVVVLISICNWIYTTTIGKDIMVQHSLPIFVLITLAVGVFPILFFILLIEKVLYSKKEYLSTKLSSDFSKKKDTQPNQEITLGNQANSLSINLSQLLCVKADGNYVELFILEGDNVKKHLIRYSLSKINEQLSSYCQFSRCHRSYVVNKHFIERVTGNARNFNIHCDYLDFSIPVSRNFPIQSIKS